MRRSVNCLRERSVCFQDVANRRNDFYVFKPYYKVVRDLLPNVGIFSNKTGVNFNFAKIFFSMRVPYTFF